MLKKAMENSESLHHSLEFVQGDAERLPLKAGRFDAVVTDMFSGLCPIRRKPWPNGKSAEARR